MEWKKILINRRLAAALIVLFADRMFAAACVGTLFAPDTVEKCSIL